MQNTNGLCCLCQNSKYKWLLQGKGSQIQINNNLKHLLNSVLVGYEELLRPGFELSL